MSQQEVDCQFGGEKAFDNLVAVLKSEKACQPAAARLHACAWGSSADTQFAPIVIGKCEKTFFDKLSAAGKTHYADEMQLCAYEFSRAEGTLAMSEAALCQVDVAAKFAANPALAEQPEPRASFSCDAARSVLERAICSDIRVGHADIVLSRMYGSLLKSAETPQDRLTLTENERRWLAGVPDACHLTVPSTPESLNCVRDAFETRFTALGDCAGPMSECLDSLPTAPSTAKIATRASFDCEKPVTSLEIVICADAELGEKDIQLAQAYRDAGAATGSAQHQELVASERNWLSFVNRTCPLGVAGGIPSVLTRSCVRTAFETRIRQLQACPGRPVPEQMSCLNDFRLSTSEPRPH